MNIGLSFPLDALPQMKRATVRPRPTEQPHSSLLSFQKGASTITANGSNSHLQGRGDPPEGTKAAASKNEISVIG